MFSIGYAHQRNKLWQNKWRVVVIEVSLSNLMGCACVKCGLLQGGYGDHLFDARDTFYCVSRICFRHVTCIFLKTCLTFQCSTYNLIEITIERRCLDFQCCENWRETVLWFWALLGTHIYDAQFIIASYNWAKFVSITVYRNSQNLALWCPTKCGLKI